MQKVYKLRIKDTSWLIETSSYHLTATDKRKINALICYAIDNAISESIQTLTGQHKWTCKPEGAGYQLNQRYAEVSGFSGEKIVKERTYLAKRNT